MVKDSLVQNVQSDRVLLQEMLRIREADPELEVISVESSPACGVGDNFMSAVTRLVVSVETVKRYSSKKCFLMKRQLPCPERRNILRCDPAFRNEADAYQRVVPTLENFANTCLPFPECHHASNEFVILSDLKQRGFKMADRRRGLNFLQASLAMKELGRFHGTSLAMKLSKPKILNSIKSVLHELVFVPSYAPFFGGVLENALSMALNVLKAHSEQNILSPIIEKLEACKGSLFQKMFEIVCPKESLSLICHGDFYVNNMLFRDNEMGIPEEVTFVDLQACRYSSLATDILYLFGSSLEKGLLSSHHETLLQMYFSSMESELSRISTHGKKITIEEIKEEVKKNALYGLILGFVLLPAVTAKPSTFDMNRKDLPSVEETMTFLPSEYFERLEDLVFTFAKLGYI